MIRLSRNFSLFHSARRFMALESAGGIVMIATACVALLVANSSWSDSYQTLIKTPFFGGMSLAALTKDVLMAVFFFAVGMELKCEMREGALSAKGQKLLPLLAALGGIAAPACLYVLITHATPEYQAGWAIPTATDIAFALCVLRLAGPALPQAAKIFLLAIAIYDDLAAILIIALFYASGLTLLPLLASAGIAGLMFALNRMHVGKPRVYVVLGVLLWFAVHASGIHPTVAGVLTGVLIPMRNPTGAPILAPMLHRLHPYVAFGILPLFAFTSTGVDMRHLHLNDLLNPLPMGIALALFFGKQIGIFGATWACVVTKIAPLPVGVQWPMVYGVAVIAGIGFTMSLFIGNLAFVDTTTHNAMIIGVLTGSLASSLWGLVYLRFLMRPRRDT